MAELEWETLRDKDKRLVMRRTRIFGGWLVLAESGYGASGLAFVPDPNHIWDGGSLDPTDTSI